MKMELLKNKVIFALLFLAAIMTTSSAYQFLKIREIQSQKNELTQQTLPSKESLRDIKANMFAAQGWLSSYLETGNEEFTQQWKDSWTNSKSSVNDLKASSSKILSEDNQQNLHQLQAVLNSTQMNQEDLINRIRVELKAGGYYAGNLDLHAASQKINQIHTDRTLESSKRVNALCQNLLTSLENKSVADNQSLDSQITKMHAFSFGFLIFAWLFSMAAGYFILRQLKRSVLQLEKRTQVLSQGNMAENLQAQDETSKVHQYLNLAVNQLKNVRDIAQQIGKGEFGTQISAFNNEGELGESMATMKDSLNKVVEDDRQRNWVNSGFAKFGDILRLHTSDLKALCDDVITHLVKYVGANQGVIFLVDTDENTKTNHLKAQACYAYERKKRLEKVVLMGEGLVGQAWQERDTLLITDLPQDYVNIRSGLGSANPNTVLIVPLMVNDEVAGVIELASFNDFKTFEVDFVKKLAETIAASIISTQRNQQTAHLLSESQQMAEMMQAQEEEMRQNMEELHSTQEEMMRTQLEIKRKEANLKSLIDNTEDTIFAIDTQYTILVVNKTLKDKYAQMGINLAEGSSILEVLPEHLRAKWKARYDRALAGERYNLVEESSGSSGKKFVETYHNPIKDENGKVIGLSVIARDITEVMTAQTEIKRKESTLHALIDNTEDTFCAVDQDYNILVVNSALRERFAVGGIQLNEGEYIFDKLPKEQHAIWKERYDRCLQGESYIITQERKVGSQTLIIEGHYHPVRDSEGNIIGASVMSKDITSWKQALDEKEERDSIINKIKNQLGSNQYNKLTAVH